MFVTFTKELCGTNVARHCIFIFIEIYLTRVFWGWRSKPLAVFTIQDSYLKKVCRFVVLFGNLYVIFPFRNRHFMKYSETYTSSLLNKTKFPITNETQLEQQAFIYFCKHKKSVIISFKYLMHRRFQSIFLTKCILRLN